jgi:hypothetical protein
MSGLCTSSTPGLVNLNKTLCTSPLHTHTRAKSAHTHVYYEKCAGVQARSHSYLISNHSFHLRSLHLSAGQELDGALAGDEVMVDL